MGAGLAGRAVAEVVVVCLVCVSALWLGRSYEVVRVAGGSMSPTLDHGDVCLVRRSTLVSVNSIALFETGHDRSSVLHRVVGSQGGSYLTRGDANPVVDLVPVEPSQVRGEVIAFLPLGHAVQRWRGIVAGAKLPLQSNIQR